MKKNKKRKQKQKQRKARQAKKLQNRKKKNKKKKRSSSYNTLSNINSFDKIPVKPKVSQRATTKKTRNFYEELLNFIDPFSEDYQSDYDNFYSDSIFSDDFYPSSYYYYNEDRYFEKMKEYADQDWKKVRVVDYEHQTSDYNNMNEQQLHFYLYWRSQARKGIFIPASYNYYLLYFVEILNLIGVSSNEEALKKLNELFLKMLKGNDYFNLTEKGISLYANLIFDFVFYHNLNINNILPEVWKNIGSNNRYTAALELFDENDNLTLPPELILGITNFSLEEKSKLFKEHNKIYREAILNLFYILDFQSRKELGKSFIESGKFNYRSNSVIAFDPFEGFAVQSDTYGERLIKSNINFRKLQDYFNGIIQEVENSFRNLYGQRGRLRKFETDEWAKNIISDFLNKEYNPELNIKYTGTLNTAQDYLKSLYSERKIEIDTSRLERLRFETEVVQELMDTSNYEEESEDKTLIYLDSLEQVFSNLVKAEPNLINFFSNLIETENKPNKDFELVNSQDLIHSVSSRFLNYPLIEEDKNGLKINDEYFDGVKYIFDNKDNYPFLNLSQQSTGTVNEEILNFLESLDETQTKFLEIIVKENSPELFLEELAESAMSMVELIFDDINNNALIYLDDIILEMDENNVPYIIEEYNDLLKNELK